MNTARTCGRWKFISAGASVPGVSWNTMVTSPTVISWPVWVIRSVGAISDKVPADGRGPRPEVISPWAEHGKVWPNWNRARRIIAGPTMMFSETACSRKPSGAITLILPAATSATLATPPTPP